MTWVTYIIYILVPLLLAIPLGTYISKVMDGKENILTRFLAPFDKLSSRWFHLDEKMNWKKYALSVITFSLVSLLVLMLILKFQNLLPGNPQHFSGLSWSLAFNTAVSFVTNTNWQSYSGEFALSNFSQVLGLTVQNFASPAVGIAVLYALIRGLVGHKRMDLGNFWQDLVKSIMYVLLPISIVVATLLIWTGVPQSTSGFATATLSNKVAVSTDGKLILGAKVNSKTNKVTLDGKSVKNAKVVSKESLPIFPQASQVAIKQLGTNGGGVLGANSAHPYENPTPFSNLIEFTAMVLIPMSLVFAFGKSIGKPREGWMIFSVMAALFAIGLVVTGFAESKGVHVPGVGTITMEGKESRFGAAASAIWAVGTTATSTGAINSMLDSFSPLGGLLPMMLMQSGEVVFGGVGSGMYGMLGFVILTVFIAGLMVGRTPEYLGKKIGPAEMRMAVLACLATPFSILVGSGIIAVWPKLVNVLTNSGPHGFSEFLYAFSSAGGNNGSSFGGFNANTPILNIALALVMLVARFVPIIAVLVIGQRMGKQSLTAESSGTLRTTNPTFAILLIVVILIIGVLSFFPALSLGPIADFLE
ncbi:MULTISPECIES: potassium-transporting ATPase subunit KdpA [Lactobacillaceae]|uniref:potassium-transporting ATPase subunit KdpA n=1 Tax=Lactobacillaceae TaxID=33958 RepID=UPI0021C36B81|nr:potassium-transporting ATPase subunit KdpA [Lacticaseibacillus paracasei]MCP9305334.1 potassium-transporting ATPase subunit KdpA [Lacticaseibacillus paracasei]MCP9311010.1 potassium-transporting ATPase subunit KdpA [Lacticaseibacillus paracasei]MCP9347631.1 potassium-transporting ATPase subunit KdpA [Lacticaseibacillus paracasei]MCP9367255.1 potassium-transporting ATPase subunit KdpA [Lacticaseibacillus paracasei]MCP9379808.1 potassium-transporting ATPase subunit KdpA [Lacticaseibacillus pa